MGRGAVNQKGPEASCSRRCMRFAAPGKKMPVNLVMVAEGEEEIGSPNFPSNRPQAGSAIGAFEMHRHLHALRRARRSMASSR